MHNTEPDLRLFPAESFDFVHSVITLQHIAPGFARGYVAEFIRVLKPGGTAYFQAPYRRGARRSDRSVSFFAVAADAMHALPADEVRAIVAGAGADLVAVLPHGGSGDDCPSHAYIVRKPAGAATC